MLPLNFYFGSRSDPNLSPLCFSSPFSPVHGNRRHGVDAGEDSCDGEEVVEAAVSLPKVPLAVQRVDEVDEGVESSHGGVGEGQVHQEVVGHRPHALVSQDDPDDDEVPKNGHCHHGAVRQGPQGDAPGGLHKLVGEVGCRRGRSIPSWGAQRLSPGIAQAAVPPAAQAPVGCGDRSHLGCSSPAFRERLSHLLLPRPSEIPPKGKSKGRKQEVRQHSRVLGRRELSERAWAVLVSLLETLH